MSKEHDLSTQEITDEILRLAKSILHTIATAERRKELIEAKIRNEARDNGK